MQTLNDALYQHYMSREVTLEECLRVSGDPTELSRMVGQTGDPEADARGNGAKYASARK